MNFNATFWGQILFVLAIIVIFFTIKFAKNKTTNVPLVGFYALILNCFIPPAGWVYCFYWYFRKEAVASHC